MSPITISETDTLKTRTPKTVILLHGLARSRHSMFVLQWYLRRWGYNVLNFGYPSRHGSLAEHAERLRRFVIEKAPRDTLNFVTHSLGGIVVRLFAERYHTEFSLERAVMLGPPNTGARIAQEVQRYAPPLGRWMGPALREIAHLSLPVATDRIAVGIIAGTLGARTRILPFVSPPNDGIVSVSETELPGCRDAVVVPGLHSVMMYQPRVMQLVAAFLERGEFTRSVD